MREGWCLWTSMLLLLRAQVPGLHMPLEGWLVLGDREGWPGQLCACSQTPPLPGPGNPSPEVSSAKGRAGLSSMAFLAPFAAGGSPGPGSRARLADRAAATGRDRPLPGETVRFCVTR